MDLPSTLGALKQSGYRRRTVKEEMRSNLLSRIKNGEELFPGIIGYGKTVIPGIVNAILSKHDFILLGLRGQAKSRLLRSLVSFLDEKIPVIEGTDIPDDPLEPVTKAGKLLVAGEKDDCPVCWTSREERFNEKLATPDITIADLIGDIDPIKAAREKKDLSDEEVIHFGIVPRTNRGIFALNELPDLPSRIQVGLLNIMEEKDIQIRGFPLRLPLDICMVYTANPEDYTNRGSIITPLKDRINSQIITHYPENLGEAIRITEQEVRMDRNSTVSLQMPRLFRELIEEVAFSARNSEYVDQKSGVSARMSISLMENVLSNMERRALIHKENTSHPRIGDLHAALPAITGKVELVYEGEKEGNVLVAKKLIGDAVKTVFRKYFPVPEYGKQEGGNENSMYKRILEWFSSGNAVQLTDDLASRDYHLRLKDVWDLEKLADLYLEDVLEHNDGLGMELLLEGLHQHSMISKKESGMHVAYQDMLKSMFDQFERDEV